MDNATLHDRLCDKVVGQRKAITAMVPYIQMYEAGLAPEGRPIGVFLLLGPTGTGKTRTVEALAEVMHGSAKHVLKIDCGEFHLEHEVAKLVGAPPGYLGHRETQPVLSQARLNSVASRHSDVSIVLLDEVEKAAASMQRLLLGVLDKGTLRLGDNTSVNFERSLIFMTSNLGATAMLKSLEAGFGLPVEATRTAEQQRRRLDGLATAAVRRHFAPEFINRIDAMITYEPLDDESLRTILEIQLAELQAHIDRRLGEDAFRIDVPVDAKRFLLARGTSMQYGAREIRRTLHRHVMQPLAALIAAGEVEAGGRVILRYSRRSDSVVLKAA